MGLLFGLLAQGCIVAVSVQESRIGKSLLERLSSKPHIYILT